MTAYKKHFPLKRGFGRTGGRYQRNPRANNAVAGQVRGGGAEGEKKRLRDNRLSINNLSEDWLFSCPNGFALSETASYLGICIGKKHTLSGRIKAPSTPNQRRLIALRPSSWWESTLFAYRLSKGEDALGGLERSSFSTAYRETPWYSFHG